MNKRLRSAIWLFSGIALGFLPILVANLFMRDCARSQGENQISLAADKLLTNVELVLQESIGVFSTLPHYRVPVCDKKLRERLHNMTLRHPDLHDLGFMGSDGLMFCSSAPFSRRLTIRSEPIKGAVSHLSYHAAVDEETGKSGLLVSWFVNDGISLSGFILAEHLIFDAMPVEYADTTSVKVLLADSVEVAQTSPESRFKKKYPFASYQQDTKMLTDLVSAEVSSLRYPVRIVATVPFVAIWASFAEIMTLINSLGIFTGAMVLFFFVRLSLRKEKPYVSIGEGIKRREFVPYYQPVIDIQSGRLAGCEVLVRWQKPDGSIIAPGSFIDVAEASGLAKPMTTLLMEQVAEDLSPLYALNLDLKAGINLFNKHFDDLSVVSEIERIFGNSGLHFNQLVFEITERQPLENLDRARAIIARIQALGSKVALDDAGTGHGGFAYLQKLGMDIIKIDKLFVDAIGPDRHSVPIVDSLSHMAKGMDMVVVAEGVENEDQLSYLRSIGVDQAQGYLFAPALPAKAYLKLVSAMMPDRNRSGAKTKVASKAQSVLGGSGGEGASVLPVAANFQSR